MITPEHKEYPLITLETVVHAHIEKVWDCWNKPEHIVHWGHARDGWTTPSAENDLRVGGVFKIAFQSPNKEEESFLFEGTYTEVEEHKTISYLIKGDARPVHIVFEEGIDDGVKITETFGAEDINSMEKQREGWSQILQNFKEYVEKL